jgi:hypothetical protein
MSENRPPRPLDLPSFFAGCSAGGLLVFVILVFGMEAIERAEPSPPRPAPALQGSPQ